MSFHAANPAGFPPLSPCLVEQANKRRELTLDQVNPPARGEDKVLVRITHSGICGTDLKIYNGSIVVRHPLIMGHEMIGEVAEDGSHFQSGDRIIVDPFVSCGICFSLPRRAEQPLPSRRAAGTRCRRRLR